jgi:hypothetical protein
MALNDDQRLKIDMVLEACKEPEMFHSLSEWEQGFISSTEERYNLYKDATRFSEKQWAVIDRIYDRVMPQ